MLAADEQLRVAAGSSISPAVCTNFSLVADMDHHANRWLCLYKYQCDCNTFILNFASTECLRFYVAMKVENQDLRSDRRMNARCLNNFN